jgi:putative polyhydroxyalkanoate system protein
MATIDIRRTHALSSEDARAKGEELAKSMQEKLGIQWKWAGDKITFDAPSGIAKGANGAVSFGATEVRVEIDLPFLLKAMKGTIEGKVKEKLDSLLVLAPRPMCPLRGRPDAFSPDHLVGLRRREQGRPRAVGQPVEGGRSCRETSISLFLLLGRPVCRWTRPLPRREHLQHMMDELPPLRSPLCSEALDRHLLVGENETIEAPRRPRLVRHRRSVGRLCPIRIGIRRLQTKRLVEPPNHAKT